MLICTNFLSPQKNKPRLLLWLAKLFTHAIQVSPDWFGLFFLIIFCLLSHSLFVFLLLYKRLLYAQNMVSRNHFPLKGIRFPGEMTDSRSRTGNVQNETRIFVVSECKKASRVYEG